MTNQDHINYIFEQETLQPIIGKTLSSFNCWPNKAEYDDLKNEGLLLGYLLAAKQDWHTHDICAFRGLFKRAYRNFVLDHYRVQRRRTEIITEHQVALVRPDFELDPIHNVSLLQAQLTPRQYQILCSLYQGDTFRQISAKLGISITQISRERQAIQAVAREIWK
ncbi:sigma-70 family RNA polymerase sigma factor [Periweissella cryptocerci]|uniref:Sigma-70 family RNA polymerase sigma factor n=1 Tax=Periweissella cryptocerci TaxID=2506420 RepID=A0A4P6YQX6_9LACO|nr:LuxR C-terminal-related transcriptional regulator [Periweissella cryptocerci]QBO35019.1 sigma-70 family RNA polymerase sigma factor [Periweissella cryptocerci]